MPPQLAPLRLAYHESGEWYVVIRVPMTRCRPERVLAATRLMIGIQYAAHPASMGSSSTGNGPSRRRSPGSI